MRSEPRWRRYLRFWGADIEADVDDEFRFHLETKIEELRAAGLGRSEARREALRQFGSVRSVRKECVGLSRDHHQRTSRAEYWSGCGRDLQYAARALWKAKASTAIAMLILATSIGATTAMFTLFDRLLFRPLPVEAPSELLLISSSSLGRGASGARMAGQNLSYEAYLNLRDRNQSFSGLAAVASLVARERRSREKIEKPAVAMPVSGNYFDVLGVPPAAGRALSPADDVRSGASHVAVAGHRFMARRFGQPSGALGKTVYLNSVPFVIVGVLPAAFEGMYKGRDTDLYVPLGALPELFDFNPLDNGRFIQVFGRMRRGIDAAAAQANLQVLFEQSVNAAISASPDQRARYAGARIEYENGAAGYPGAEGERKRTLEILAVIVALLLLIGSANVACLLVARGSARQQEIAIRLALGAGKWRILRQSLAEGCLLSLAGGAAGLLVSLGAARLVPLAFRWHDLTLDLAPDWRVLGFGLAIALATGVLFGVAPALQLLRGGRPAFTQQSNVAPFTTGKGLVVVEVALSLILIAGASAFIRSFQNLRTAPTGFTAEDVSVLNLAPKGDDTGGHPPIREAMELAGALHTGDNIESAGLSAFRLFNDGSVQYLVAAAGAGARPAAPSVLLLVDGNHFGTLRIPMVAGRTFTPRDDDHARRVAILGEGVARRLFPDQSALGRSIYVGKAASHPDPAAEIEIVGIVRDTKFGSVAAPPPDLVYLPLLQGEAHSSDVKLSLRSTLPPPALAALVRSRIENLRLPLTVAGAGTIRDDIGATLVNDRIRMQTSSLFGILALLLIAAGLYGLMAYIVMRRTREIGIRMAVGSNTGGIVALVLKQTVKLVAIGIVIGLPGAYAVLKAVSGITFGLPPLDLVSVGIAAVTLCITGVVASAAPAWRAAHLDPVKALRVQ